MNKAKLLLYVSILFFSIKSYSQSQTVTNGNHIYKYRALGWTIRIPDSYSSKSELERPKVAEAAAKSLNASTDKRNTELLLSFIKDGATAYPTFLSGLQNKNTLGAPIKSETDFINFISTTSKKITPNVVISTFKKKIGNKEFFGYQFLNPDTKIYQKGLIKIIDKWIFYQTWVFDNEEDRKNLENAVFTATFESSKL